MIAMGDELEGSVLFDLDELSPEDEASDSQYIIDYDKESEALDDTLEDWVLDDEVVDVETDAIFEGCPADGTPSELCDDATSEELVVREDSIVSADGEMNIYGIYLGDNHGDCTLIESKGEYLLMDSGQYVSYPYIKAFLDKMGVTKLSLYYSHLHSDHTGGFSPISKGDNCSYDQLLHDYDVQKVYLPDPGIVEEIDHATRYKKAVKLYDDRKYAGRNSNNSIVYLKAGSSFTLGSATVNVIGPIDYEGFTLEYYRNQGLSEELVSNCYINNRSLVSQITCGTATFLTCGDCAKDEEAKLVKRYGDKLKADVLKLSHHGDSNSNTIDFLRRVSPTYVYGLNSGDFAKINEYGMWATHKVQSYAKVFGTVYMVGYEKKPVRISAGNNGVRMYCDDNLSTPLSGYVKLLGGTGKYYKKNDYADIYDYYWLGQDGRPLSGIRKYNGKKCYFSQGGCRMLSNFTLDEYLPIGFVLNTKGGYDLRYIDLDGTAAVKAPKKYNGSYYYFGGDGVCVVNKKVTIDGVKYKIGSNGKIDVKNPKKTAVKAIKSGKDKIVVEWKEVEKVNGYEVYIATSKNGKYKKASTVKKQNATKKTIKKLKYNKNYYVKIRTYRKFGEYTLYSDWSSVKKIKTKK